MPSRPDSTLRVIRMSGCVWSRLRAGVLRGSSDWVSLPQWPAGRATVPESAKHRDCVIRDNMIFMCEGLDSDLSIAACENLLSRMPPA